MNENTISLQEIYNLIRMLTSQYRQKVNEFAKKLPHIQHEYDEIQVVDSSVYGLRFLPKNISFIWVHKGLAVYHFSVRMKEGQLTEPIKGSYVPSLSVLSDFYNLTEKYYPSFSCYNIYFELNSSLYCVDYGIYKFSIRKNNEGWLNINLLTGEVQLIGGTKQFQKNFALELGKIMETKVDIIQLSCFFQNAYEECG